MGNIQIDSESAGSEAIEPVKSATNYSRWMTDLFHDIKSLKLGQIVFPGAHNAGADDKAIDFIGHDFTVCQDGRFLNQFRAGVRYSDLRMVDNSYRKVIGNHSPTYKFVERFEFQHGTFGNRLLEDLISDVEFFARGNPGELLILHFKSYDTSRTTFAYDSLARFFKHLERIKPLLLPKKAQNHTVEEIVTGYPGQNVILVFPHGTVPGWSMSRTQFEFGEPTDDEDSVLWGDISQRWSFADSTERGIAAMIAQTMKSPPIANLWCLSATVYDKSVVHLPRSSPVRTIPFAEGGRRLNILMADFIEREATRVSVVDECINLTLQRAVDVTPPTVPTNLLVRQVRLSDEDAKDEYYQNTTLFSWGESTDAVGLRYYEIFQNNNLMFRASDNKYFIKDMNKLNSVFKVRAIDSAGLVSAFSAEVELIQDTVPPTMPSDLVFDRYGFTYVQIAWTASSDENGSGAEDYEVQCNGRFLGVTQSTFFNIRDAAPNESLVIEIRAKDRNKNYSEWASIIRSPLPELKEPRVSYVPLDMDSKLYLATITWAPISKPETEDMPLGLQFSTGGLPLPVRPYNYGESPTFIEYVMEGKNFEVKASLFSANTWEVSPPVIVPLNGDLVSPEPAGNFRVVSHSATEMVVSWDKSNSTDVVNYAISANGLPPFLVPATASSYTLPMMSLAEYFMEIWSIDRNGNTSIVESIKWVNKPPEKPNAPHSLSITLSASGSANVYWSGTGDKSISYIYWLTGYSELSSPNAYATISNLAPATTYKFNVVAVNELDMRSDSLTGDFTTGPAQYFPTAFRVTRNENRSISFRWDPPVDNADKVEGYTFKTFPTGSEIPLSTLTCTVQNLLVGIPMVFGVRCRFQDGSDSEWVKLTVIPKA